jgi:hypothetical protein
LQNKFDIPLNGNIHLNVFIQLAGIDDDGDLVTLALGTPPSHGSVSGTPPNVVYTPAGGFIGIDRFTFTVSDGFAFGTPGTITVHVADQGQQWDASRTILIASAPLDVTAYHSDPSYRRDYLLNAEPGRIWNAPQGSLDAFKAISAVGSRFKNAAPGTRVTLQVTALARSPVTFLCLDEGSFAENRSNVITVEAEANAIASVTFIPPSSGRVPVLASSPTVSGNVRFLIEVQP